MKIILIDKYYKNEKVFDSVKDFKDYFINSQNKCGNFENYNKMSIKDILYNYYNRDYIYYAGNYTNERKF